MVWRLAWPAMKPTIRSVEAVGVTAAEMAEVRPPEAPFAPSSGEVVSMPENSWTSTAVSLLIVTVTDVTGLALGTYHSSPPEAVPAEKYEPILTQVLAPESLTPVMALVVPEYLLAESTSRRPAPVATGNVAVSEVA